ncbi:MAG: hydrogen peroxide-inducible genes activator [Flavobacteriaceae bacterium]|jgi:LysR family hydrogen peroxide-inducible transcriptional activator|nr:hydrogen peroxide-inducible genes activator [Flavobacteriaceae bacterium]MDG2290438.1 hydrogen peroxide-inducible genes activator [Flavobacteriaceae bacterium]
MTITQLKYCIAVAEYRNFTTAAQHVYVTQPTLSMQIQKLEQELDLKIFDRTQKPIGLTAVGEKIIQQAHLIVAESDRIQDVIQQEKGVIGGNFKLGIIPTVMSTLLPLFLQTVLKAYPKLILEIEEMPTQQIIENLEKGTLDAGIAATPLDYDHILEKPLYYEPFMVYAPTHSKLNKEKSIIADMLKNEQVLLLQDGHCFRNSALNICKIKHEVPLPFEIKSGSFETLVQLAEEGLGITLLPYLQARKLSDRQQVNLKSFKTPEPAREVSMIYHQRKLKLHIVEALHDKIRAIIRGAIVYEDIKIISPK